MLMAGVSVTTGELNLVGGWDKSPGPDNHYASAPMSRVKVTLFAAAILGMVAGVLLLVLW